MATEDQDETMHSEEQKAQAESFKDQGNEQYKRGDYRSAIELYSKAIEACPIAPYYGNRAAASMMLGHYEEVVRDCNKAIELDSKFLKAHLRKAKAQLSLGMLDEALDSYRNALLHDPKNSTALNEKRIVELTAERVKRARTYLEKGKYAEALSCISSALEAAPGSLPFKLLKARALTYSGKVDEAYSLLTQLMRVAPNNPEIIFLRAKCLYFQGEFPNAIKHLQQALRSDPDNAEYSKEIRKIRALEAKKQEGNVAFKSGDCPGAVKAYSECLEIDPSNRSFNAILHCNRAAAYSKMRQYKEAVDDCDAAVKLDPSYAKAYLRRAQCLRALGEAEHLEQALRDYEEAAKLVGHDGQREISGNIRETKLELKKAKRKDYYKILGIAQNAGEAEIKKAYRKKALEWHPDRWSGKSEDEQRTAEKMFKDVGEGYAVLSDPVKKERYDSGMDLEEVENGGMGGMGGMDPSDLFSMFMGMQGGHGGARFGRGHPFGRSSSSGFDGPFGFDGGNVRFDFG